MFNPNRPHGIVYNHPTIAYEQDGVCYGFDREPVTDDAPQGEHAPENLTHSQRMKAVWAKRKAQHEPATLPG